MIVQVLTLIGQTLILLLLLVNFLVGRVVAKNLRTIVEMQRNRLAKQEQRIGKLEHDLRQDWEMIGIVKRQQLTLAEQLQQIRADSPAKEE